MHKNYIHRECEENLKERSLIYPVVSVMGPRQAGKTEMILNNFPHLPYYDLEVDKTRSEILKNPAEFVRKNEKGAIFDEVHHVPALLSEIKALCDELIRAAHARGEPSVSTRFVLTGSHDYLLTQTVTESLVGRTALIKLMSMTASEVGESDHLEMIFKGGYPVIHINQKNPSTFFPEYIGSYLEREIRRIHNVKNWEQFEIFMEMCANRVGKIIHYDNMASHLGVKVSVIREWLSLLQATYIIFMTRPYHEKFEKRVMQNPKLYFYDTGLASYLLGIKSAQGVKNHPDLGHLFENLVIGDINKKLLARNRFHDHAYFWNVEGDHGYEVDLLLQEDSILKTVEIKTSDKFDPWWFNNAKKLGKLTNTQKYIIYTGPTMDVPEGKLLHFKDAGILL